MSRSSKGKRNARKSLAAFKWKNFNIAILLLIVLYLVIRNIPNQYQEREVDRTNAEELEEVDDVPETDDGEEHSSTATRLRKGPNFAVVISPNEASMKDKSDKMNRKKPSMNQILSHIAYINEKSDADALKESEKDNQKSTTKKPRSRRGQQPPPKYKYLVRDNEKIPKEKYVQMAKSIQDSIDLGASPNPFVLVAYGNAAFVPMFYNWICNTAFMKGVHKRTLIVTTDEAGYRTLSKNRFQISVAQLPVLDAYNKNLEYDTYGYWKLTETRVNALGKILKSGTSFLLFEPDAIWVQNPLEDPHLITPGYDIIGFSDNSGGIGFGWLLLKSNPRVIALWEETSRLTTREIDRFKDMPLNKPLSLRGEQRHFNKLVKEKQKHPAWKNLVIKILPIEKYCSGQWYDGGRGGNGLNYRRKTRKKGLPFVVQNNWIVSNPSKIKRAKRWGHWFLDQNGKCPDDGPLKDKIAFAINTFKTLRPKRPPPKSECPKC
jgi:hypothetical protein